jgi:hypothetical protein
MRVLLSTLLLPVGLLAGCGGDDEPEPVSGPGLPAQAHLKTYFEAITSSDPDALAKAESAVTAPGSPAQGYAAYVADFSIAAAAAGQAGEPVDVEEVDNGFKACVGDGAGQCATWTDLEGKDGRLADFTVNGKPLHDLLVDLTSQPPVKAGGLYEVQPDYAYRQPTSGKLYVVCKVTAFDVPLSPKPGSYIEDAQILKGVEAPSPATIDAGTSSPVILAFEKAQDAKLDGQITFDLQLGGKDTQSIGFGLADPAAS